MQKAPLTHRQAHFQAMLDPFSALSVASAAIQFVQFGCQLVSETQEIYHSASGATKDNITIGEITNDIKELSRNLKKQASVRDPSADDLELGRLVSSCYEEAERLTGLLETLEVPANATKWASFRKAIKNARKQGKVEKIEKRLSKIQRQIDYHLQFNMRYIFLPFSELAN